MLQTPNTSKQIITFNSGSKYSRLEFPERIDNDPHETANLSFSITRSLSEPVRFEKTEPICVQYFDSLVHFITRWVRKVFFFLILFVNVNPISVLISYGSKFTWMKKESWKWEKWELVSSSSHIAKCK